MRLHLVSLPWTQTTAAYSSCAYTQKVRRFGKMMMPLGYEVIIYSGEENDSVCTAHVPLITEAERTDWFGEFDPTSLSGDVWNPDQIHWMAMNTRAILEISKRSEPGDLLLLSSGWCQKMIADALPGLTACEPFVGYKGIATPFRAFESHAWRQHVYGRMQQDLGTWYDATIPNFFDLDEFPHLRSGSGDYLLFLGRVTQQKGPHIAAQIAEQAGMPLKVAGPGAHQNRSDRRAGILHGDYIDIVGRHVEYLGAVGIEERAHLLADAACVLMPTLFIEPFGGVAVEAMLSGTPVIAPDWGAFTEHTIPGVSGCRFSTIPEAVEGVAEVSGLDPQAIREYAAERYSLEAVATQFDRWFQNLAGLRGGARGDFNGVSVKA